jgi:tetratricopeptide (TPR) repeat protein
MKHVRDGFTDAVRMVTATRRTHVIRLLCIGAVALSLAACHTPGAPKPDSAAAPASATSSATGAPPAPAAPGAPLFNNLGSYTRSVTTTSDQARRYFVQGMMLTYGFNHAEAGRSFREAARLDPQCAACWWGAALVLGPNINLPMADTDVAEAWSASRKALSLIDNETPLERALIEALAKRYAEAAVPDRSSLDRAYADAMREVARQFPDDPDVLALFAESILDLSPWDYYQAGGQPKPTTVEAIRAIEHAIEVRADHPGALHYYIHAKEAADPDRAVVAADRLWHLAPGAGHLVHMPAHIYIRVGRYHDAVLSNLEATAADQSYIAQCNVQGFYPLAYYSHNWHFVWAGSTLEGNRKQALDGAAQTHHVMHGAPTDDPLFGPVLQHMMLAPVFAATRFAQWDAIDALPAPEAKHIYPTAIWHQARGTAAAARGDLAAAERELAEVQRILANPELKKLYISTPNTADVVVGVAERMLAGDIAARRKNYPAAIAALEEGLRLEDSLKYNEPEDWQYPVRLLLGAVLLDAGRPAAAESAYRGDLDKHRENDWALFGLEQALRAQKKTAAADEVHARFEKAWAYSDVKLTASVLR